MNGRGQSRRGVSKSDVIFGVSFTLIIITLVATLSFRGKAGSRGAPRMECSQRMRDFAIVLNVFDVEQRGYPGYRNFCIMKNGASYIDPKTGEGGISWFLPMSPYWDYAHLQSDFKATDPWPSHSVFDVSAYKILSFNCPSDPPATNGGTPLSYMLNTGCIDSPGVAKTDQSPGVPRDWAANGVFFDRYTGNRLANIVLGADGKPTGELAEDTIPQVVMTNRWIADHDGTSNTLMLTENIDHGQWTDVFEPALGVVWDVQATVKEPTRAGAPATATPTKPSYRINANKGWLLKNYVGKPATAAWPYEYARPSSNHTGGVNVVFCDTHTMFLSEQIDYFVYCLLMTPDGKNAKAPGQTEPLKHEQFGMKLEEGWFGGD